MKQIFFGFTIIAALNACTDRVADDPWQTDAALREHLIAEAIFHGASEEEAMVLCQTSE